MPRGGLRLGLHLLQPELCGAGAAVLQSAGQCLPHLQPATPTPANTCHTFSGQAGGALTVTRGVERASCTRAGNSASPGTSPTSARLCTRPAQSEPALSIATTATQSAGLERVRSPRCPATLYSTSSPVIRVSWAASSLDTVPDIA